jgi:threonine dehydratase
MEASAQMSAGPGLAALRAAQERIAPHVHRTPVFTCEALDAMAGAKLFFKCENLQKTGSFKIRGATNAVFSLSESEAKRGVVAPSSGNHAAALARAAQRRGVPAWIVMPSNSPLTKRKAVEGYGGAITLCEPTIPAREAATRDLMAQTGAVLIHPYNNEQVICGQGTATLELLDQVADLDAVIAPVSGGGLLSGTSIAAKSVRPQVRVIGAEPKNADDAYRSLKSGRIETNATANTIADGLRAQLCDLTFAILRERVDEIVTITEEEIVEAMRHLWERMKLVVESSGAISAAPALFRKTPLAGKRVGILLSGGNLDLADLPFK